MRSEYLRSGEVVRPQGVRGELKLRRESQDPTRYARLKAVWLKQNGEFREYQVKKGRVSGDFAYLLLAGIESREDAEALRGQVIYVDRAHAIALPEGEHFICDLIGLRAETEDGTVIGRLREVIQTNPACDIYAFDTERGEMMMPALRRVILSTDVENGVIRLSAEKLAEVAVWQDEPAGQDECV